MAKYYAQIVYRGKHTVIEGPFKERKEAIAVIKAAIPECYHADDNFFLLRSKEGKLIAECFSRLELS